MAEQDEGSITLTTYRIPRTLTMSGEGSVVVWVWANNWPYGCSHYLGVADRDQVAQVLFREWRGYANG